MNLEYSQIHYEIISTMDLFQKGNDHKIIDFNISLSFLDF
jgi:hypothetical protein